MQYSKGDKDIGSIAQTIVEHAKYSADEMAETILKEAGKNTFLILPTYQPQLAYHLKRLFPKFFLQYKALQFSLNNGEEWLRKTLET